MVMKLVYEEFRDEFECIFLIIRKVIVDRYCVVLELGTEQGGLKDSLRIGSVCSEKLVVRTLIIYSFQIRMIN
jgi:hypothetical protein